MSEEFLFRPWESVFSDFIKTKEELYKEFTRKYDEFGKNKIVYKPERPYGRENILGVGLGFKNFPPQITTSELHRLFRFMLGRRLFIEPMTESLLRDIFNFFKFEKCIKVFVRKKAHHDEVVNPNFLVSKIMKNLGYSDFPVDVVELETIEPTSGAAISSPLSGGHISLQGGTIGAIVKGSHGKDFMLSCAHVLVDLSNLHERRIVYPSRQKGGSRVIGNWDLYQLTMNAVNEIDAAVASFEDSITYVSSNNGHATDPTTGELVHKIGAESGYTSGVVNSGLINLTEEMRYRWGSAMFKDVFAITSIIHSFPTNIEFSQEGDSGSIIQSDRNNAPLGLLFAKSTRNREQSFMCRTTKIQQKFNVRF